MNNESEPLLNDSVIATTANYTNNFTNISLDGDPPGKKKAKFTNGISPEQIIVLNLIKNGTLDEITNYLKATNIETSSKSHINVLNFFDWEGNTLIHHAIRRVDDPRILRKLLDLGLTYQTDLLLKCIKYGNLAILKICIQHLEKTNPKLEFMPCTDTLEFPAYMNPLMLACLLGADDIIKYLLERMHYIEKPHVDLCKCQKCKEPNQHKLDASMEKLNIYQSLTNESYLCLTSTDPMLEAFLLSNELDNCAENEPELRKEYDEINVKVRTFAVELLSECLNSQEAKIILNEKYGCEKVGEKAQEHFTRVKIAHGLDQKEFIAHSITQRLLHVEWLGEWSTNKSFSITAYIFFWVVKIILLPFIILSYCLLPNFRFSKQLKSPVNKFVSYVVSYIIFLSMLFLHSEFNENTHRHGPPNTGLELFIIFWVFGLTWLLIKTFLFQGSHKFFSLWWNWYDILNLIMFYSTFIFWILSYRELINKHSKIERKFWASWDPTLIAEGNFAVAKVLAFGKLLNMFQINKSLGPLQVSLGRMANDMIIFLVVYFLVLLSFATGLNHFYYYYDGMIKLETNGLKKYQMSSFTTLSHTYKTLFWALFGMSPIESADVVIGNFDETNAKLIAGVTEAHSYTQTVGYLLFALFHLIAIIIFLNIMIAMMSNSFQKVQDNADVEWKFARTAVWMSYFEDGRTLPPPINMLPSMKSIMKLLTGQMFRKKKDKSSGGALINDEYQVLINIFSRN